MLALIAWAAATVSLAAAVVFSRRAPAASLALVVAVAAGVSGFAVSAADGPRRVPADVAMWASGGLVAAGVAGLIVTRAGPPARALLRASLLVLGLSPVVAALVGFSLEHACPLYVTRRAGYCYHPVDVLGGWVAGVAFLSFVDTAFIAIVLYLSSRQARSDLRWPDHDHGRGEPDG